jgi:acetyl-CoA carboxylase biotin carboxyl carrier protein
MTRPTPESEQNMATIVSPLPGVFYRKPGPGKPPFANEGDAIEVGQTIGIVEIMKQFTEIQSDVAGTLESFAVNEGEMVNPGDSLVVIREG